MADKNKSSEQFLFTDGEEEIMAYQRIVKDLNQDSSELWVDAIKTINVSAELENEVVSWVVEDNCDVLSEYMDEMTDVIDSDDIDNLDW